MTKNEYIASIMLEAAELLKDDSPYNTKSIKEDYYNYQLLIDTVNESIDLFESIDRVIDKYENNIYYSLNESVGSAIWEGIKKLCGKIRKWWQKFKDWIKGGKRVAKENSEVVDPAKATKVVDDVIKAYNSNDSMEDINVDNIKKSIKKGDPIPNYDSLDKKIDNIASRIEKENDEEKAKCAREALSIINKINSEMTKSNEIFLLPASKRTGDHTITYEYDKDGTVIRKTTNPNSGYSSTMYTYPDGRRKRFSTDDIDGIDFISKYSKNNNSRNPDIRILRDDKEILNYESRKNIYPSVNISNDDRKFYVDEKGRASETLPKKKKAANRRKQAAKEAARAKGKQLNETIELLYDEALLAESIEEFDIIMECIDEYAYEYGYYE